MSMNEGHFGSSNVGEHPMGTSIVSLLLVDTLTVRSYSYRHTLSKRWKQMLKWAEKLLRMAN